jgi:hypothetical protein
MSYSENDIEPERGKGEGLTVVAPVLGQGPDEQDEKRGAFYWWQGMWLTYSCPGMS